MSYAEIKHALNSTVGTNKFKPLDHIVGDLKERLEDPVGDYHIFSPKIPGTSITEVLAMNRQYKLKELTSMNNREHVILDINKRGILMGYFTITLSTTSYLFYFCNKVTGYLIYDFGYGEIKKDFVYTMRSGTSNSIAHTYVRLPETSSNLGISIGNDYMENTPQQNSSDRIVLPYPIKIERVKVKYKIVFEGIKSSSSYNSYLEQNGYTISIAGTSNTSPIVILGRE